MPKKKPARVPQKQAIRRQKGADSPRETLASRLSLKAVRIIESHAKLDLRGGEFPSHSQASVKVGCGPTDDGAFVANVAVTVNAPPEGQRDTTKSSLMIVVVAQCLFNVRGEMPQTPQDVPEDDAAELHALSTLIAWPYVRAYVQSITASMAIPPITIPLIRIGANGVQADESD